MFYVELVWFWLAIVTLVASVLFGLKLLIGNRQIGSLAATEPLVGDSLPKVSIIVAGRNEEPQVEGALRSLLLQDYTPLEIIAVNDRSTDATGEIMDRLAADEPRLRVIHVEELPAGWLGKNHALNIAAQQARGEFLLFTDADVVMHPTVVRRAVRHANENNVDHLAILPQITMPNWFLESFVVTFAVYFLSFLKPWKAKDPKSRYFVGIGAFNLLRADVYRAIGTHRAIAMRPDDDLKLGKLVKKHGFRQELLYSGDLMSVPWYGSRGEIVVGLEKNAFSGVDYRVTLIVGSSLAAVVMHVWPVVAVAVTWGATRWLNLAIVVWLLLVWGIIAGQARLRPWTAIAFPLTVLLFVFIQWRAMILAFKNKGIRWRDTHYPLAELKANKV